MRRFAMILFSILAVVSLSYSQQATIVRFSLPKIIRYGDRDLIRYYRRNLTKIDSVQYHGDWRTWVAIPIRSNMPRGFAAKMDNRFVRFRFIPGPPRWDVEILDLPTRMRVFNFATNTETLIISDTDEYIRPRKPKRRIERTLKKMRDRQ